MMDILLSMPLFYCYLVYVGVLLIIALLPRENGPPVGGSCLRYMARAREENLKVLGIPRSDAVADSYNFYRAVVGNQDNKTKDRIDARTRIDKLLGLELKLPPLEVLSAHLGITVQQLVEFIGEFARQGIPRSALPAPEASGPDQVP
jgi:hypothetical protein